MQITFILLIVHTSNSLTHSLHAGFYDIVPEPLLSVFDFQELELLLHGLPNIDMDDWVKNTDYTGTCRARSVYYVCCVCFVV